MGAQAHGSTTAQSYYYKTQHIYLLTGKNDTPFMSNQRDTQMFPGTPIF